MKSQHSAVLSRDAREGGRNNCAELRRIAQICARAARRARRGARVDEERKVGGGRHWRARLGVDPQPEQPLQRGDRAEGAALAGGVHPLGARGERHDERAEADGGGGHHDGEERHGDDERAEDAEGDDGGERPLVQDRRRQVARGRRREADGAEGAGGERGDEEPRHEHLRLPRRLRLARARQPRRLALQRDLEHKVHGARDEADEAERDEEDVQRTVARRPPVEQRRHEQRAVEAEEEDERERYRDPPAELRVRSEDQHRFRGEDGSCRCSLEEAGGLGARLAEHGGSRSVNRKAILVAAVEQIGKVVSASRRCRRVCCSSPPRQR